MPDTPSLRDRYFELIDQIVQTTLKGNIRSKEQVYQLLAEGVSPGTGEIFEQCLQERYSSTEHQVSHAPDELKQAKASRSLRAIQTIRGEWQHWQEQNKASEAIATAIQQIITADAAQRLTAFLQATDPNRPNALSTAQLKQLMKVLQQHASLTTDNDFRQDMQQLSEGVKHGLESWTLLQDKLVSWIYDQEREIGFDRLAGQKDPWSVWAKQLSSPLLVDLLQTVSLNCSIVEFAAQRPQVETSSWIELAMVLRYLQEGLVAWFEQIVYDSKVGSKLSISIFLMFAIIWSQLARGFEQTTALNSFHRSRFADGAFQITLQLLRSFAQRPYFPLYGGVFAAFPGSRFRSLVDYLDEPLQRVEGTQEKARILTLLGSSERAKGLFDRAQEIHAVAREIAAAAGDYPCEIANLNHLSRTYAAQKNFEEAINYSQRALILSRQQGDRQGEANALVNLGYSEVLQANQREQPDPETYESAIHYLQQGVKLSEQLEDVQSQAFGFSSLGIAHVILEQPETAIPYLAQALKAAQSSGDLYLQGSDLAYLAEAYYQLKDFRQAIYAGSLGMYYLESIASLDWRRPAGLLTILQGQMNHDFQAMLQQLRPELIAAIGVDGYDYLPQLLDHFRQAGA